MKAFFRAYDAVIDAFAWLCGASLAAVFVLIVAAVSMRIANVGEPDWILPTTEYAMLFIGTLGAPWLLRERGHVCVDIVRASVSLQARRRLAKGVAAGGLVLCLLLLYFTVPVMRATWGEYEMRAYLTPKPLLVAPIGVTFFLLAIGFLRALLGYKELYEDTGQPRTGEL